MNPSLNSIVFITGTFISNTCWDEWVQYFENQGYKCIAPPWPFKEASAEELRNRPARDAIASNTISSVTDYFASIISAFTEKPILIGHSLGGLVVQLLLQRELAAAGVALHSFPPQGVTRLTFSFLRALWEAIMLFTSSQKTYMMSFRKWKYSIANGMTYEQQKQTYYKYAIPESKKIVRDAFKCLTRIDFKKSHAPLLITSGRNDRLIPASLNYSNYKMYSAGDSITDYREFKDHTHLIFGQEEGIREAELALCWLQGVTQTDKF